MAKKFSQRADDLRRRLAQEAARIMAEQGIEDYLQAADLGLFTSESESFCLSILEAMCFACPSIARNVGGIPEVIEDNVSGTLVASEDADELARAVEKLSKEPLS